MHLVNHLRRHTIGYLALFVALSGSAYAAAALPINSVGTAQVKNHSLLKVDFKNGQIPAGKKGARGPAGTFNASNVSNVAGPMASLCAAGGGDCAVGSSTAQCANGSVAIGGGWVPQADAPLVAATVVFNGPTATGTWGVLIVNNTSALGGGFQAFAVCASGGVSPFAHRATVDLDALRQTAAERLRAGNRSN